MSYFKSNMMKMKYKQVTLKIPLRNATAEMKFATHRRITALTGKMTEV